MEGFSDASMKLPDDSYEGKFFDQKIEDKDVNDYISDYSTKMCKEMIATDKIFNELGLTLSDTDERIINNKIEQGYDSYNFV